MKTNSELTPKDDCHKDPKKARLETIDEELNSLGLKWRKESEERGSSIQNSQFQKQFDAAFNSIFK